MAKNDPYTPQLNQNSNTYHANNLQYTYHISNFFQTHHKPKYVNFIESITITYNNNSYSPAHEYQKLIPEKYIDNTYQLDKIYAKQNSRLNLPHNSIPKSIESALGLPTHRQTKMQRRKAQPKK